MLTLVRIPFVWLKQNEVRFLPPPSPLLPNTAAAAVIVRLAHFLL